VVVGSAWLWGRRGCLPPRIHTRHDVLERGIGKPQQWRGIALGSDETALAAPDGGGHVRVPQQVEELAGFRVEPSTLALRRHHTRRHAHLARTH
jgi:hypothetical protein